MESETRCKKPSNLPTGCHQNPFFFSSRVFVNANANYLFIYFIGLFIFLHVCCVSVWKRPLTLLSWLILPSAVKRNIRDTSAKKDGKESLPNLGAFWHTNKPKQQRENTITQYFCSFSIRIFSLATRRDKLGRSELYWRNAASWRPKKKRITHQLTPPPPTKKVDIKQITFGHFNICYVDHFCIEILYMCNSL